MKSLLYVLLGWALTVATCWWLGGLLLTALRVRLRPSELHVFRFLGGAAVLSSVVFALMAARLYYKGTALAVAILAALAAWRWACPAIDDRPFPPLPRHWRWLFGLAYAGFGALYLIHALPPEASPDGSNYHLGLVARYVRERGFPGITTNMYASLSQGLEMLFAFAFVWGRHAAASLVHLSFLLAAPWLVLNYGRRVGEPVMGALGAILFFAAPVVGQAGTIAYNDVAAAANCFAVFALVQLWDETRHRGTLALAGLLAGFCFAIKYTAFVAVVYAALFILWRARSAALRPLLLMLLSAAIPALPWLVKNAVTVGNPIAPFGNRLFPNPHVHASFEETYRRDMARWGGLTLRDIPLEVTIGGQDAQGVFGPVFLLSPLALFALRYRAGRHLVPAALLFLLPYPSNLGTRFLLPGAIFVAPALALTVSRWPGVAPLLAVTHCVTSWPSVLPLYVERYCWRLDQAPIAAAFRQEPEEEYLRRVLPSYVVARLLDERTPPGSRVLALGGVAESYTTREVLQSFQSGLGHRLRRVLNEAITAPDSLTTRTFVLTGGPVRRVRLVLAGLAGARVTAVSELRVLDADGPLAPEASWKPEASPFPWIAGWATDGNLATHWSPWDPQEPGQWVGIDFGRPVPVRGVQAVLWAEDAALSWQLRAEAAEGQWIAVPTSENATLPVGNMRREAMRAVRREGITHLLVQQDDHGAEDFRQHAGRWGIREIGARGPARLYAIVP